MAPPYPARLYAASERGSTLTGRLGEIKVERQIIEDIEFPSGQVVACDPLTLSGARAFEQTIAPGAYPVELYTATIADHSDPRVAIAILRVAPTPPVEWKMATLPGQRLTDLRPGHYFGYGVDSGTGSIMDLAAASRLEHNLHTYDSYMDRLIEAMQANTVTTGDWAMVTLDVHSGLNCAIFSSGIGDGVYASYWGYDDAGQVACLMTDFGLLIEDDQDSI